MRISPSVCVSGEGFGLSARASAWMLAYERLSGGKKPGYSSVKELVKNDYFLPWRPDVFLDLVVAGSTSIVISFFLLCLRDRVGGGCWLCR